MRGKKTTWICDRCGRERGRKELVRVTAAPERLKEGYLYDLICPENCLKPLDVVSGEEGK